MKNILVLLALLMSTFAFAQGPEFDLAQMEPRKPINMEQAEQRTMTLCKPINMEQAEQRTMTLYEQGWEEGVEVGDRKAGKIGWFFAGFGNVPLMWLPWVVEPRRPAKPPIVAEEEFNSGYKNGYRAGWKNAHKAYYIAGTIASSAAATAVILSTAD